MNVQASAPVDLTALSVARFGPMIRRCFILPLDMAGRYPDRVRVLVAPTTSFGHPPILPRAPRRHPIGSRANKRFLERN